MASCYAGSTFRQAASAVIWVLTTKAAPALAEILGAWKLRHPVGRCQRFALRIPGLRRALWRPRRLSLLSACSRLQPMATLVLWRSAMLASRYGPQAQFQWSMLMTLRSSLLGAES